MNDLCPCGAVVRVDSVTPDFAGWVAVCEAGHRLLLTDLGSPGVILDTVETGLL